jgi:hypothetical protein
MTFHQTPLTADGAEIVALEALAYVVANDALGRRLLALTGLDAETLRKRAGTRSVLAATLEFLAGHEADLVACAAAIGRAPCDLTAAHAALAR